MPRWPSSARTPSTASTRSSRRCPAQRHPEHTGTTRPRSQTHVEFDAERVWVSGPTVLASWHAAFTRRTTAERVRQRGFMTLELDEAGLIARFREWSVDRTVGVDRTYRPEAG